MGGCLAMVYVTGVTCPAWTEFFRSIGATELHFGLLGGIPMAALLFQFVGAVVANRVSRRAPLFIAGLIASRALCIPIVLIPLCVPKADIHLVMSVVLILIALRGALTHVAGPLWFSWMADLVPHRVLNRYWGSRQAWMTATWAACYLGVAVYTELAPENIRMAYPPLVMLAVAAGIIDVLLFCRVDEPPNHTARDLPIRKTLLAPLRDRQYRVFVLYSCFYMAGMMFAAAFMQLYCLKVLGLPLWQVILIWCVSGVGNAVAARFWGRIADRHGHRPVMAICAFFKPVVLVVFLLVSPHNAIWILPPVFFLDGMWNSGNAIASNGFVMKIAPRRNRSMFIAAFTGLAGLSGGLAAMLGGVFLESLNGIEVEVPGRTWGNYHLLLAVAFVLRVLNAVFVHRLHEPTSSRPVRVLNDIRGVWPLRFLRFPVGMYRRWTGAGEA